MEETVSRSSPDEHLLTGDTGRVFIALSLGMLATSIGRQLLPPLLPTIIDELRITPAQAGFALTLMWGLFALLQFPAGRLSDRLSRTTVLVSGLCVMVAGFGVIAVVPTYGILLVALGLVGGGAGLYIVSMRAFLSDLFVERRGQAFGLNTAAGMGGGILAAGFATVVVTTATWQTAFLPVVGVLVVAAGQLHLRRREPYVFERVDLGIWRTVSRVFGSTELRWLAVEYSLVMFAWQGVFGFLPTFLQTSKGFSPELANLVFAVPFGIGIVVMPLAGSASDRLARLPVAVTALLVSALGLCLVVFETTVPLVVAGVLVFATGLVVHPPVMQAYLMDVFPDSNAGGDFGAFRTFYFAVSSVGPAYVGWVAEWSTYTVAFGGLAVCLLAGAAILFHVTPSGEWTALVFSSD